MPEPDLEVRRSARRRRTITVFREGGRIVAVIPGSMTRAQENLQIPQVVKRFLAKEARSGPKRTDAELALRAQKLWRDHLSQRLGELPPRFTVTWVGNQNRRWGSCTPAEATIRLSSRLQSMPAWVSDYVLIHELVHLVEPTHSERFWNLVRTYPLTERAQGFLAGYQAGAGSPPIDDQADCEPFQSEPVSSARSLASSASRSSGAAP